MNRAGVRVNQTAARVNRAVGKANAAGRIVSRTDRIVFPAVRIVNRPVRNVIRSVHIVFNTRARVMIIQAYRLKNARPEIRIERMNKRIQRQPIRAEQSRMKRHRGRFGLVFEKLISQSRPQNIFDVCNLFRK